MSVSIERESPLRARMTSWRSSSSRSARWAGVIRVAGLAAMAAFGSGPMLDRTSRTLNLIEKVAASTRYYKGLALGPVRTSPLRRSLFDRTATHFFQACTCLFVDSVGNPARPVLAMLDRRERRRELAGADLRDLLARRPPHGGVRGHEADALTVAMLGGKALEQRVRVRREPHLERPVLLFGADTVEDDHAARAAYGNEAREQVDELPSVLEPGRV